MKKERAKMLAIVAGGILFSRRRLQKLKESFEK